MTAPSPTERKFVLGAALLAALFAAFPFLYGALSAPPGSISLGIPINTDDHMVYAAWMRQAMEGRFLFDNRFAVDPQPGLTVHLFFLVTGWLAKLTGIPAAMAIARVGFTVLFVFLAHKLVRRVVQDEYAVKLSLGLVLASGGLGYLAWHNFGVAYVRPASTGYAALTGGLPIDVWQPEAFVFPSLLTAGLFTASLCLIAFVFLCVLDAREGWKPVLPGALAFGVLMNIHSYDVLLVTLVLIGFLVMRFRRGEAAKDWVVRAAVIGAGAIPPALWFMYVLQQDAVFQARAATETYSPAFRQLLAGILPLFALSILGLVTTSQADAKRKATIGIGVGICAVLWALSAGVGSGYLLNLGGFLLAFAAILALLWFLASENPALDLVVSWAWIGLVAPYFPALFQRKLAMGIGIPWAILAALGIIAILASRERSLRNLATAFALVLCAGSSLMWIVRIKTLTDANVSSTTVHPVFLSRDLERIIQEVGNVPGRKVALAMPGVANQLRYEDASPVPDSFASPVIPDWNPFLAGLAGAYAYAGHWSETPDYIKRRDDATRVFLRQTPDDQRIEILERIRPDFIVAPRPDVYGEDQLADLTSLGETVFSGNQFVLIRFPKTAGQ